MKKSERVRNLTAGSWSNISNTSPLTDEDDVEVDVEEDVEEEPEVDDDDEGLGRVVEDTVVVVVVTTDVGVEVETEEVGDCTEEELAGGCSAGAAPLVDMSEEVATRLSNVLHNK